MVRRVPAGTVASYGRIAAWLGKPEAARAVGGAMARSPDRVPAHRVVTSGGRPAAGWEREAGERGGAGWGGGEGGAAARGGGGGGARPRPKADPVVGRTSATCF